MALTEENLIKAIQDMKRFERGRGSKIALKPTRILYRPIDIMPEANAVVENQVAFIQSINIRRIGDGFLVQVAFNDPMMDGEEFVAATLAKLKKRLKGILDEIKEDIQKGH